ncbi:MOSC domain-containing protein [Falsiroseomonas oryzae]|uniref:MOSC domain-containing protein n=1 Tax=Falsiroseomonas oryzae TaxID=2766473 RepID=UPI0022EB0DC8|nr:MOSC domain-containing protein [Roseomonas sp. MO-31]
MRVERISRFPVKGLSPEQMEEVDLSVGAGLPHDRRFAFAHGDSPFDPADPKWLPKRNFACLAAHAGVARIHSAYDPRANTLLLRAEGVAPLLADLSDPAGRDAAAAWITAFVGEEARGALTLAEVPGHAFTDIPDKAVSIIGTASIAELGQRAGMALDPLRFRANVLFSGAAPFAELEWVGRELLIGKARLRVLKRIQRCAATEVNPETAERDARPPRWLRSHYGHADMGVYAVVLEGGRIAVGDALELPDPA